MELWDLDAPSPRILFRPRPVGDPVSPGDPALDPLATNGPAAAIVLPSDKARSLVGDFGGEDLEERMATHEESVRALLPAPDGSFLITAGSDRRIRYWDCTNSTKSYLISAPPDDPPTAYSSFSLNNLAVFQERLAPSPATGSAPVPGAPAGPASGTNTASLSGTSLEYSRQRSGPAVHHYDCITDLNFLELPARMLISAGRDGVVKVWK